MFDNLRYDTSWDHGKKLIWKPKTETDFSFTQNAGEKRKNSITLCHHCWQVVTVEPDEKRHVKSITDALTFSSAIYQIHAYTAALRRKHYCTSKTSLSRSVVSTLEKSLAWHILLDKGVSDHTASTDTEPPLRVLHTWNKLKRQPNKGKHWWAICQPPPTLPSRHCPLIADLFADCRQYFTGRNLLQGMRPVSTTV